MAGSSEAGSLRDFACLALQDCVSRFRLHGNLADAFDSAYFKLLEPLGAPQTAQAYDIVREAVMRFSSSDEIGQLASTAAKDVAHIVRELLICQLCVWPGYKTDQMLKAAIENAFGRPVGPLDEVLYSQIFLDYRHVIQCGGDRLEFEVQLSKRFMRPPTQRMTENIFIEFRRCAQLPFIFMSFSNQQAILKRNGKKRSQKAKRQGGQALELQEECTLLPQEECAREPQKVDVSCPTILDQCVSADKPSFIQIHKLESCYNGEHAIMHMNAC